MKFKEFLRLFHCVLQRGSQYTTSEVHNLTHYVHGILARYVTHKTFSKAGITSIEILVNKI